MGYHIWERDGPITHSAIAFVAHFCEVFAGPTGDTQAREQPHHLQQGIKSSFSQQPVARISPHRIVDNVLSVSLYYSMTPSCKGVMTPWGCKI